jgi:hypothetical protein
MENPELNIATQFALQTRKHFFLTGKAGTGKTTLLKSIASQTHKNYVIVAPTGVAAINAGGVTIHSMFHLPTTSFIPTSDYVDMNVATNRRLLLNHLKFRREKLRVIQEMEMLIIDEVSMVRCDVMDAIDFALRTVRHNREPFGGVQVMFIGDMFQLPPVVRDNEWQILKQYYAGPFFFDSKVWNEIEAVQIELKKVFRQSDDRFISLLNNIRHQNMGEEDFEKLSERYQPDFSPNGEGYVLLSTHNKKADDVNRQELDKLIGRQYLFEAKIDGDFPESMYPCERVLQLKEGAQVMFIKNDVETGIYFNGKLATVKTIAGENITVTFNDSQKDYTLRTETWENISYSMEAGTEKIDKKVMGTFTQFPLRLAWAITIHKSQGLTFEKVIIDAGKSFASGQVYVALSRCRTLDGIVLHSLIRPNVLLGDERINSFSESHHKVNELKSILADERKNYAAYLLKQLFDFTKLYEPLKDWKEMLLLKDIPDKEEALQLHGNIIKAIDDTVDTASKFGNQLDRLLKDYEENPQSINALKERSSKAVEYFADIIFKEMIKPLHEHIVSLAYAAKMKLYVRQLQAVEETFWIKLNRMYNAYFIDEKIYSGTVVHSKSELQIVVSSITSGKKEKGGTFRDSLDLYKQGKSIEQIADVRKLTISTIKSHFARWIQAGEIDLNDVLNPAKADRLKRYMQEHKGATATSIKSHFGNEYDYGDIAMVQSSMKAKAED